MLQKVLLVLSALILMITAAFHMTGLAKAIEGLVGEQRQFAKAAWIIVALDWLLIAIALFAAASGLLTFDIALLAGTLPITAGLLLSLVMGPKFPGFWLLAVAGSLTLLSYFQ